MKKMFSGERGFSLVEIIVAMAIATVVIGAVVGAMIAQQKNHITQETLVDMQQGLRAAMEVIGSDLRMAGYDPTSAAGASILVADTSELQFQIDRNGDGDWDSGEIIRFALTNDANRDGIADGTPCDLGRELDGGGLLVLAENIDALNFVYFDSSDNVLPVPVADLSAIGSIQLTLIARSGATLPAFFKRNHQDNRTYQNRQGDIVLPPQNDSFHRMEIVHEFKCRNLLLN